jgi:hypothetical protein
MLRTTIRDSIEFVGVIAGCPDHQWLVTDAIWDVRAGPTKNAPQRWLVASKTPSLRRLGHARVAQRDVVSASPRLQTYAADAQQEGPATEPPASRAVVAWDRATGWTAAAPSAAALAERIRRHFSGRSATRRVPVSLRQNS